MFQLRDGPQPERPTTTSFDRVDQSPAVSVRGQRSRRLPLRGRRSAPSLRCAPLRATPPRARLPIVLFRGHSRWIAARDHRRQRCDVPVRHPAEELQQRSVEEPHGRDELVDLQHPRRDVVRRAEHPAPRELAVEPDLDERSETGFELGWQLVGERSVQRQDGAIEADRDRSGERVYRPSARRRSSARSVSSHEKPLRPKWPYAAVSR